MSCSQGTFLLERENLFGVTHETSTTLNVSHEYFIRNAFVDIHELSTELHDAKQRFRKDDRCLMYLTITESNYGKNGQQFSILIQVDSLTTDQILLSNKNTAIVYFVHYPFYKLEVISGLLKLENIEENTLEGKLILECTFRIDDKKYISGANLEKPIFRLNGYFQLSPPLYSSLSR